MNSPSTPVHDSSHEQVLHLVVTGELQRSDPRVRQQARTCEVCREHLSDTQRVTSLLDEVFADEASTLSELDANVAAPGADRIEETLKALAAAGQAGDAPHSLRALSAVERAGATPASDGPEPAPRRVAAAWRISLAAAAVLVAGWLVRLLLPPSEAGPLGDDVKLGSDRNVRMWPEGAVDVVERFEWEFGLQGPVRYALQIWGLDDKRSAAPRINEETWDQTTWTPAPEELDRIPEDFRWRVEAFDQSGHSIESAEAKVQRPSSH